MCLINNELLVVFVVDWGLLLSNRQLNLYWKVTFWTKKKWPYKKGDLLKEVQFIWSFLLQDKENVTF
jgi:hypothetical protein